MMSLKKKIHDVIVQLAHYMPFCGFISLQAPVQFQIDKYHLAFQDVTYFIKEH